MKILLTGATGQVGSALWKPLAQFGVVVAPDRKGLDLSRPDRIAGVLDNISPDLIINLGAYTAVDLAEDEHELAFRVNEGAPRALAQWAFHHDIPVIHLSTDYVFDGSGDRPWKESDSTGPLSIYGASKLAGELAIRKTGCAHLILRTSWVFASKGRNFLNTIVRLARERPELRVVADQIGAPTSARAIADGLVSILSDHSRQQDLERVFNSVDGLVHISCCGETSFHGFATAIVEGLRHRGDQLAVGTIAAIETKDFPTKAVRPLNSRLNMRRLEDVLGVKMPGWQTALAVELDDLFSSKGDD